MKTVIQRVKHTALYVEGALISEIPFGLAVYFGVAKCDTLDMCEKTAKKIAAMRIFEDENGKMNRSVKDVGGEILLISQFTLLADASKGNRPSFDMAEERGRANLLYEKTAEYIKELGITVKQGVFGADMQIIQHNDGPVTIIYSL